ncbi:MAG: hypothetical protein ACD_76C00057G0007 [uncultured bacterium]|nr:MAG: hypothetical protein ACD_76C00057G0007 [uncultured bacterium]
MNRVFIVHGWDGHSEEGWETIIDFTKFRKGGIPASELIKILELCPQ